MLVKNPVVAAIPSKIAITTKRRRRNISFDIQSVDIQLLLICLNLLTNCVLISKTPSHAASNPRAVNLNSEETFQ